MQVRIDKTVEGNAEMLEGCEVGKPITLSGTITGDNEAGVTIEVDDVTYPEHESDAEDNTEPGEEPMDMKSKMLEKASGGSKVMREAMSRMAGKY